MCEYVYVHVMCCVCACVGTHVYQLYWWGLHVAVPLRKGAETAEVLIYCWILDCSSLWSSPLPHLALEYGGKNQATIWKILRRPSGWPLPTLSWDSVLRQLRDDGHMIHCPQSPPLQRIDSLELWWPRRWPWRGSVDSVDERSCSVSALATFGVSRSPRWPAPTASAQTQSVLKAAQFSGLSTPRDISMWQWRMTPKTVLCPTWSSLASSATFLPPAQGSIRRSWVWPDAAEAWEMS